MLQENRYKKNYGKQIQILTELLHITNIYKTTIETLSKKKKQYGGAFPRASASPKLSYSCN